MANKDLSKSDPVGDIEAQMNRDFNTVIRKAYNSLSPAQKLEVIRSRRGKSKKESNKILNQLENKDEIFK